MGKIAEEHLHRDSGNGACTLVGNVTIQVGNFVSSQIGGFAHGQTSQREAARIGVQGRVNWRNRYLAAGASAFQNQDGCHN